MFEMCWKFTKKYSKKIDLFYYNVPVDMHKTFFGGWMTIIFFGIIIFVTDSCF